MIKTLCYFLLLTYTLKNTATKSTEFFKMHAVERLQSLAVIC